MSYIVIELRIGTYHTYLAAWISYSLSIIGFCIKDDLLRLENRVRSFILRLEHAYFMVWNSQQFPRRVLIPEEGDSQNIPMVDQNALASNLSRRYKQHTSSFPQMMSSVLFYHSHLLHALLLCCSEISNASWICIRCQGSPNHCCQFRNPMLLNSVSLVASQTQCIRSRIDMEGAEMISIKFLGL